MINLTVWLDLWDPLPFDKFGFFDENHNLSPLNSQAGPVYIRRCTLVSDVVVYGPLPESLGSLSLNQLWLVSLAVSTVGF